MLWSIRPSVCPSVCLFHAFSSTTVTTEHQETHAGSRTYTGQRDHIATGSGRNDNETVASATLDAFTRWLHRRCTRRIVTSGNISFRHAKPCYGWGALRCVGHLLSSEKSDDGINRLVSCNFPLGQCSRSHLTRIGCMVSEISSARVSGYQRWLPVVEAACQWLYLTRTRYDFLLAFYSEPRSWWIRCRIISIHMTCHREPIVWKRDVMHKTGST